MRLSWSDPSVSAWCWCRGGRRGSASTWPRPAPQQPLQLTNHQIDIIYRCNNSHFLDSILGPCLLRPKKISHQFTIYSRKGFIQYPILSFCILWTGFQIHVCMYIVCIGIRHINPTRPCRLWQLMEHGFFLNPFNVTCKSLADSSFSTSIFLKTYNDLKWEFYFKNWEGWYIHIYSYFYFKWGNNQGKIILI